MHINHQALVNFNQVLNQRKKKSASGRKHFIFTSHEWKVKLAELTGMLTKTLSISAAEKNFFRGFRKYWRETTENLIDTFQIHTLS